MQYQWNFVEVFQTDWNESNEKSENNKYTNLGIITVFSNFLTEISTAERSANGMTTERSIHKFLEEVSKLKNALVIQTDEFGILTECFSSIYRTNQFFLPD